VSQDSINSFECRRFTAAHDCQSTILRTGLPARNGPIDKMQMRLLRHFKQFARYIGRNSGVIDKYGIARHAGKSTVRPKGNAAQIVIVANASKYDIGITRRLPGGRHRPAAIFVYPLRGTASSTIEYCDMMASSGKMARHRITHHAETEKSDSMGMGGDG
jgi:hypothetical protein